MPDNLIPLTLFALAGALTPGPNNIMVAASGQAFGLRRSWPHIAGVTVGFAVMQAAFGLGLIEVFKRYPDLHGGFRIIGALYLLYLAWRIAKAGDPANEKAQERPIGFFEAALFQWVNPKAWTFAIGVVTAFTTVGGNLAAELALIIGVFSALTVPSLVLWCLFGVAVRTFLHSERHRRIANLAMAGLVVLSVAMMFV